MSEGEPGYLTLQSLFATAGVYRVDVHAEANSSLSIFWTNAQASWPYPELPTDMRISVTERTQSSACRSALARPPRG